MEKEKLYEIEIMRTGVTPREFFNYCKREFLRRCPVRNHGLPGRNRTHRRKGGKDNLETEIPGTD